MIASLKRPIVDFKQMVQNKRANLLIAFARLLSLPRIYLLLS